MNNEELEDCAEEAALYVLGSLPSDRAGAFEQRLRSGNQDCLVQAQYYSAVAEQLSLSVTPVEPPPDLRQRVLDRIQTSGQHMKIIRAADGPWVKMPFPGVEIRSLMGDRTFMIRLEPGAVLPAHPHPQAEQCYVLEGSVTDSAGVTLHAGDFVVMSRGIQHDPIRSKTGCTLLIAYAD